MSAGFGHIGGIPLEEGLPMIVPTACALALLVRTRLYEVGAWLRRR